MKRYLASVACALLLLATGSVAVLAQSGAHIKYSVDASTATPAATVVQHGKGLTVVIFKVASITAGDTYSFTLDMTGNGKKASYPVDASLEASGDGALTAAFNPATVTFASDGAAASSVVTLTAASTPTGKKITTMIKADPSDGHMGKGPGVKVVVLVSSSVAASAEQRMLNDVRDALGLDAAPPASKPDVPENW